MKNSTVILIIFFFLSCAVKKNSTITLEGQKWTFSQQIHPGVSGGNSWTFLKNNNFTEESWYSGGMYWTHHFNGTYEYDIEKEIVYLKYTKNKSPNLKGTLNKKLHLKITKNDTTFTIHEDWEKSKKTNLHKNLRVSNTIREGKSYKIEYITDKNLKNK